MFQRAFATDLRWTLCRSGGGDPDPLQFDSYAKATEYLARRGLRVTGRDTDVRVVFYASAPADE